MIEITRTISGHAARELLIPYQEKIIRAGGEIKQSVEDIDIMIMYVRKDSFTGCAVYDRARDLYLILLPEGLDAEEERKTLLHETYHILSGDMEREGPEDEIERRCCQATGTQR